MGSREEGKLVSEGGAVEISPTPLDSEDIEVAEENLGAETTEGLKEAEISGTAVPSDEEMTNQPEPLITNPAAKLEEKELMETENQQDVLKRQAPLIQSETKWRRHREEIKRN